MQQQQRAYSVPRDAYLTARIAAIDDNPVTRSHMMTFFGDRAVNGDYSQNYLCYAPWNHMPKYLPFESKRDREQKMNGLNTGSANQINGPGRRVLHSERPNLPGYDGPEWQTEFFGDIPRSVKDDIRIRPFPLNQYVSSGLQLSDMLKSSIVKAYERGESIIEMSSHYGIKKERIEAVIKLGEIEKNMEAEVCSCFL